MEHESAEGNFYAQLSVILYSSQQYTNFENRLRLGKVISKIWHRTFLRHNYSVCNLYSVSGERSSQFKHECRSKSQRFSDVGDDLWWIHRMLVSGRDLLLLEIDRPIRSRLLRLVLPFHLGAGVLEQLYQPFHLCRQISRLQGGCHAPVA